MKTYRTLLLSSLCAMAASCLPAEEMIEDTGVASFVASFETAKGAQALWGNDCRLLVIDSKDTPHKFDMSFGAGTADGEFSGIINPQSTVSYAVYASDENSISYDARTGLFEMNVPDNYNPSAAGTLVTANNAAIGVLQGSRIELKSVCGFIRFSLESNGSTFESEGKSYDLTDLKKITINSLDGKFFAGDISSRWDVASRTPEFAGISNGSSTVSFNTRKILSSDGEEFYEAGDYWIPVAPQTYENVLITLEDAEGHKTSLTERSIDVSRAMASNLGLLEWPTVVLSANFLCSSATESKEHEVYSFASENLMCDRVSNTTGQTVEGKSKKNTVVDFEHQGVKYQLFATNGYGRSTNTSSCLLALMFNTYTPSWTFSSDTWTVGSPTGYAWVRIPEHDGILTKIELTVISKDGTPVNISSEVDPMTGAGSADIVAPHATKAAQSTYQTLTLIPANTKPGIAYYICMGNGHSYRIQAWKFHYKAFDN